MTKAIAGMVTVNRNIEMRSNTFIALRDICGYIENGGGSTVKLFQDDATQTWHVHVGDRKFYGETLM